MESRQRIKYLYSKSLITEKDYNLLTKLFDNARAGMYLTGSARWSDTFNDIDVVFFGDMNYVYVHDILGSGACRDGKPSGSLGSIRLTDSAINLIAVSAKDIEYWKTANALMDALQPVEDKKERTGLFEIFRGLAKSFGLYSKPLLN